MNTIAEELEKLKLNNQFRRIPAIDSKSDGVIVINGQEYKNFASNDYLSISTNAELKEEFLKINKSLMSSNTPVYVAGLLRGVLPIGF